jgi:NarL family two-component system response regulator YdfI
MSGTLRVAILAPSLALRLGLRALLFTPQVNFPGLEERLQVVYEAASLGTFLDSATQIDVLLIDGELLSSAEINRIAARNLGQLGMLVISDTISHSRLLLGLPLRGWGILSREATGDEIQAALVAVAEGLLVGTRTNLQPLFSRLLLSEEPMLNSEPERLTEREEQVLQLLALGLANKQIAHQLKISEHTVKFHVSSILTKFGAASRTEAIRIGVQRGLVSI